jgi:hypothetical protein
MLEKPTQSKTCIDDETLPSESYARVLPELEALSADELLVVNFDITAALSTTLGALPKILALRSELAEKLPCFDQASLDKLEDYAFALQHAHVKVLSGRRPADDLDAVVKEAVALRDTLFVEATALAHRGRIESNKLKKLKKSVGYKTLAVDLLALANVLRSSWASIEGRSGVAAGELEHAVRLGQRLLRLVGLREQAPPISPAALDLRLRAFTLFFRTYNEVRRAVSYLRWNHGDADRIAPSLYAGRSNGRRKLTNVAPTAVQSPALPTPVVAGATSGTEPSSLGTLPTDPFVV